MRQSDPLFGYLFIIALEVLLIHIRDCLSISGIKITVQYYTYQQPVSGLVVLTYLCWCVELYECELFSPIDGETTSRVLRFIRVSGASYFGLRFRVPRFMLLVSYLEVTG